jgi:hypothetical protein
MWRQELRREADETARAKDAVSTKAQGPEQSRRAKEAKEDWDAVG